MKWEKIIIAAISAAFAVILYILLPIESSKYRLRLEKVVNYGTMFTVLYSDLDGDGDAEFIRCKKGIPVPAIVTQESDYQDVRQWNLNGEWVERSEVKITDLDDDGYKEIIGFTYHRDSVWIHIIEALQEGGIILHKAIDKVQEYNDHQDWQITLTTGSLVGDGAEKCIISIRSGYTLQPRGLYICDPNSGDIRQQESIVWNAISDPLLVDIDQDGCREITGNSWAPRNVKDSLAPYPDSCAWFMVYDKDLRFKFLPRPYAGAPSYFRVLPLKIENKQYLLSLHFTSTNEDSRNLLELWEWKMDSLTLVRSRVFAFKEKMEFVSVDSRMNGCFYVADGDKLIKLNHLLKEEYRKEQGHWVSRNYFSSLDLDGDGEEEQLVYSKPSRLTILRNDFSHHVSINLGTQLQIPMISCFTEGKVHYVNVFRNSQSSLLVYSKNPFYPFRILIIILSFLAYYFVFSLLLRFQRKGMERRQAAEHQVLQYQLANVMQQLDPHFLFNALSNISSYYHKGDKEHAQNYLAKLSKLIRSSLENSERMTISLSKELIFVKDYLYVEAIRMGDRFDYSIDVDDELIEGVQIPKMLIQNFVENAMKHGIRHLTDRKGQIRIYSSSENGHLVICVEDNGVGRARAREIGSFGTGNGLNMVRKTLNIFEKLEKVRISFDIEDLVDDNKKPSGTRVVLKISTR